MTTAAPEGVSGFYSCYPDLDAIGATSANAPAFRD
jgi:hypothetical protein